MIPFLFVSLSSVQAEPLSLSTDQALAIHLSQQGLDQIGTALQKLIPPSLVVTGASSTLSCSSDSELTYTVSDVELMIDVNQVAFTPSQGRLRLDVYGALYSNAISVDLTGDCSVLTDLEETCDLQIPTTSFQMGLSVDMNFDGTNLSVQASDVDVSVAPIGNPISNCLLADVAETILGQQPDLINNLILSELENEMLNLAENAEESLGSLTEDLFLTEQVDVLGALVDIELFPSAINIDEYGVWIGLGGAVHTDIPENSCADTQSYLPQEESPWPSFTGAALSSGIRYDAGIFASRSFANNVMYALWATGKLCIDVAEFSGLALNGELAGNFFSPDVTELLQNNPVDLSLSIQKPPEIDISDDQPPFSVTLQEGALTLVGEYEYRDTRVLEVGVEANIGAYITLEDNKLIFDLPLSTDDFILSESYSELIPSGYSAGVPNLLDIALGNFEFGTPIYALPTPLKLNWQALVWEPSDDGYWQAGYVFFDTTQVTPIAVSSCSAAEFGCNGGPSIDIDVNEELGCNQDLGGCEGSCSTGGTIKIPLGRFWGISFLIVGTFLRRRR